MTTEEPKTRTIYARGVRPDVSAWIHGQAATRCITIAEYIERLVTLHQTLIEFEQDPVRSPRQQANAILSDVGLGVRLV